MQEATPFPGDADAFWGLVREYEQEPERRREIVDEILQSYGRSATLFVVDTCGFTRIVRGVGIVAFLALLERLARVVAPALDRVGGRLLFREADNFFALMPDPEAALACGEEILERVRQENRVLPPEMQLAVSIGIGHGDVLVVGSDHLYGDEMNLACKIGEDLAGPDEILVTPSAREALMGTGRPFEERRLTLSGVDLLAFRPLPVDGQRDAGE